MLLYHWLGSSELGRKRSGYLQKSQELLEGLKQVQKYRSSANRVV